MPRGESIRAAQTRTGQSQYGVRKGGLDKNVTFRQRREERFRQQKIREKREERTYLPAPAVAGWTPETTSEYFPGEAQDTPHGTQGPFGPSPAPAWDYYWPTRTICPPRPRTLQARYSADQRRLEVIFRDGTPWHYDEVPPGIWTRFKRVESPGRYINAVLNGYPYGHGGWGSIQPSTGGDSGNGDEGE